MKIIATGSALPKLTVTNEDLAKFLDTSDEWITSRTGIRERRILSDESLQDLAVEAAENALAQAGLTINDIDYIICSNVHNAYLAPSLSCVVREMMRAECPCFDLNGACAGFIYALETADAHLHMGRYKTILVISAEATTRMADWTDRSTCVLFGDAAAAAVVRAGGEETPFLMSCADGVEHLYSYHGAGNSPYAKNAPEARALYMNGQEVYKYAVSLATADIHALCEEKGIPLEGIDWFVLHQANLRIIDAVKMRIKQPSEKFPLNIQHYGNTSSASVPLLLDQMNRAGKLKRGDHILMSAFGAGLTAGSCLLTW